MTRSSIDPYSISRCRAITATRTQCTRKATKPYNGVDMGEFDRCHQHANQQEIYFIAVTSMGQASVPPALIDEHEDDDDDDDKDDNGEEKGEEAENEKENDKENDRKNQPRMDPFAVEEPRQPLRPLSLQMSPRRQQHRQHRPTLHHLNTNVHNPRSDSNANAGPQGTNYGAEQTSVQQGQLQDSVPTRQGPTPLRQVSGQVQGPRSRASLYDTGFLSLHNRVTSCDTGFASIDHVLQEALMSLEDIEE